MRQRKGTRIEEGGKMEGGREELKEEKEHRHGRRKGQRGGRRRKRDLTAVAGIHFKAIRRSLGPLET